MPPASAGFSATEIANLALAAAVSLVRALALARPLIAFPTQAEPGTVPSEKIDALGFAVGPMLTVLYLLSLVFLSRYRLTRAQHTEVLNELARRRDAT